MLSSRKRRSATSGGSQLHSIKDVPFVQQFCLQVNVEAGSKKKLGQYFDVQPRQNCRLVPPLFGRLKLSISEADTNPSGKPDGECRPHHRDILMTHIKIVELAENIMNVLREDYPGQHGVGWMWTQNDLDHPEEIYFECEGSVRRPPGFAPLSEAEEVTLFKELQRLVAVEIKLQESSLEYAAHTWVEWIKKGEPILTDDGHPLTKRVLARVKTLLAEMV